MKIPSVKELKNRRENEADAAEEASINDDTFIKPEGLIYA